jgi:hypothetical protein
MVYNHVNRYGFENHIIFDDQWQKLFDGYWRRCVRKIDPKTGIDERSINNANRVSDLNSKK